MRTTVTTIRSGSGSYIVRAGDRSVAVDRFSRRTGAAFNGWIARAEWDRFLYTDPLPTKRAAVHNALAMLADAKGDRP